MKFGEALKLVFEAHYEDLASTKHADDKKNTRYTNEKLHAALKLVSPKWKQFILQEFAIIEGVIRRDILSCPHTNVLKPYSGWEDCADCCSHRSLEREDQDPNSYNERMVWSKWKI